MKQNLLLRIALVLCAVVSRGSSILQAPLLRSSAEQPPINPPSLNASSSDKPHSNGVICGGEFCDVPIPPSPLFSGAECAGLCSGDLLPWCRYLLLPSQKRNMLRRRGTILLPAGLSVLLARRMHQLVPRIPGGAPQKARALYPTQTPRNKLATQTLAGGGQTM